MSQENMPKTNYSRELRKCMDEITPIIRKYDCMALVMLESGQHAEFRFFHDPSWSILKLMPTGAPDGAMQPVFQFRKERHREGELTTGSILSLQSLTGTFFRHFSDLEKLIRSVMRVDHTQTPINNEDRE